MNSNVIDCDFSWEENKKLKIRHLKIKIKKILNLKIKKLK